MPLTKRKLTCSLALEEPPSKPIERTVLVGSRRLVKELLWEMGRGDGRVGKGRVEKIISWNW